MQRPQKRSREDKEGRDWSDVATSQGMLGVLRGWKKQGRPSSRAPWWEHSPTSDPQCPDF